MMSALASTMPLAAWRSGPVLRAVGAVAGRALGVGKVQLTGTTSNRQHFDANPLRIWYVTASRAVVEGQDLGLPGPLAEQAHLADFYFPQRGMFAGRARVHQPPRAGERWGRAGCSLSPPLARPASTQRGLGPRA